MSNKEHEKYIHFFKNKINSITTVDIPNQPNSIKGENLKKKISGFDKISYKNSIEDALGEVISRKPTMAFYDGDERLQKLEEEDWVGTCTTWGCEFEPNRIEKLEEEDWR